MGNPIIKVTINSDGTIKTNPKVTLDKTPFVNTGKRVVDMNDVDPANIVEGATLVYHANEQKFVVEPLDSASVLPFEDVDGGQF